MPRVRLYRYKIMYMIHCNPARFVPFCPKMERKPQQQTLSIRISETLREFLERYKNVLSTGRGEAVSTSDAAKFLLESAKDDPSDFRLEVADLQREATASLSSIREKWEIGQPLSRAEWVFLGQYVQIASEEISENPAVPAAPSFIDLLKALLAIRGLRADRGIGLDRYYLENLGVPVGAALNERQLDPGLVPRTVAELTEELKRKPAGPKPAFAGRCFYVALRDEAIADLRALNRALAPLMPTLVRLAARGHWIRERSPVRKRRETAVVVDSIPPIVRGDFQLNCSVGGDGEVSMRLEMDQKHVLYPIGTYPKIREFAAMLSQLKPGGQWRGTHFFGFTEAESGDKPALLLFRGLDGITLGFTPEEWQRLNGLLASALGTPKLAGYWKELGLIYGEL